MDCFDRIFGGIHGRDPLTNFSGIFNGIYWWVVNLRMITKFSNFLGSTTRKSFFFVFFSFRLFIWFGS